MLPGNVILDTQGSMQRGGIRHDGAAFCGEDTAFAGTAGVEAIAAFQHVSRCGVHGAAEHRFLSPGDHDGTGDVHGIHGKRRGADGAGLADQPHRPAAIGGKAAALSERSAI